VTPATPSRTSQGIHSADDWSELSHTKDVGEQLQPFFTSVKEAWVATILDRDDLEAAFLRWSHTIHINVT
jgi:hypothetical protein